MLICLCKCIGYSLIILVTENPTDETAIQLWDYVKCLFFPFYRGSCVKYEQELHVYCVLAIKDMTNALMQDSQVILL